MALSYLAGGVWQGIITLSILTTLSFHIPFRVYLSSLSYKISSEYERNNSITRSLCLSKSMYGHSRLGNKVNIILRYSVTFCCLSLWLYFLFTEKLWSRECERSVTLKKLLTRKFTKDAKRNISIWKWWPGWTEVGQNWW